ncbi:MAG: hypothetical protein KA795_16280 [Burkholderiaceae bacterium]|nr:hypothetical protein [Burkholderiaceae bacterium]
MTLRRAITRPCRDAGTATVEDGIVLLDGPDGVAVAMTADAAEQTAHSLLAAAAQARGQDPAPRQEASDGGAGR